MAKTRAPEIRHIGRICPIHLLRRFAHACEIHTKSTGFTLLIFCLAIALTSPTFAQEWSQPVPVGTQTTIDSDMPVNRLPRPVSDGNGTWVITSWNFRSSPRTFSGYWTRSADHGNSWSGLTAFPSGLYPKTMATNRTGAWVVAGPTWDTLGGIHVSRSSDNAQTWTTPAVVITDSNIPDEPNVATNGAGTWLMTRQLHESAGIYVSKSTDKGQSWSAGQLLGQSLTLSGASITHAGSDNWLATWGHSSTPGIAVCRSQDDGTTFTQPQYITSPPSGFSDRQPRIACDSQGSCIIAFARYDGASSHEPFAVTSQDAGLTWGTAISLSAGLPTGLYSVPSIQTDGRGSWVSTFAGGSTAYSCYSTDGITWTAPVMMFANPSGFIPRTVEIGTDGKGAWLASIMNGGTNQPTHPWISRATFAPPTASKDWQLFE